jgi:hypothetical protein
VIRISIYRLAIITLVAGLLNGQTPARSPRSKSIDVRLAEIRSQLVKLKQEGDALEKALAKAWEVFNTADADDAAVLDKEANFIQTGSARQGEIASLTESLRDERDELEAGKKLLVEVRICKSVFLSTIDKKASDLTVRESETIKVCRQIGLYK